MKIKKLTVCNKEFNYGHPTISKDGKMMVIVTNESGKYQLLELIRTKTNNWIKRSVIYSSLEESIILNPIIIDNQTIYFSSNMKEGEGKFDIYKISKLNEKWQNPINMSAFNSIEDDLGIMFINHNSGYISSNRFDKTDSIYYFEK